VPPEIPTLALQTHAPVVPVAIVGAAPTLPRLPRPGLALPRLAPSRLALPRLGLRAIPWSRFTRPPWPLPGRMHLRFGPPLSPEPAAPCAAAERVRDRIALLLEQALAEAAEPGD
jgi:hypothetical protein